MTTLNGLPKSWESFFHGICSRRKLTNFSRLWEDCTQEEARLATREEKLGDDENQALQHIQEKEREEKRFILTRSFKSHKRHKYSKGLFKLQMLQLLEDGTHC
jgi:hypothetical protein